MGACHCQAKFSSFVKSLKFLEAMNPNDIQKDMNTGSGVEGLRETDKETTAE